MARTSTASKKTESAAAPASSTPAAPTPVVESAPAKTEKKVKTVKSSTTEAKPSKAPKAQKEAVESEPAAKQSKRTKAVSSEKKPVAEKKTKSESAAASTTVQKRVRKPKSETEATPSGESSQPAPKTLKRKRPASSESTPASGEDASAPATPSPIFSVLESLEKRARKSVSQETVKTDVDFLRSQLEKEIDQIKSTDKKNKGVRILKVVNKSLRYLQSDLNRVLKTRTKSNRAKNTSSGFMKPVRISKEMAAFTSSDPDQLYSRVHITKFLCKYIKDHSLQNPNDRRQIICDDKLASLLKIDRNNQPALTYPGIQQHIQQHFTAVSESELSAVAEESAKP
jgi:upstream activation factor subunit UAF30